MTDLLAAEFAKLRSLRSPWVMLLVAAVVSVAIGVMRSSVTVQHWASWPAPQRAGFNPLFESFQGLYIAQLAVAALGVLAVTGEYSSGQIRTTFAAVPHRTGVLAAKAVAVGAVTAVAGTVLTLASFLLDQAILGRVHAGWSIARPGVPGALVSTVGYLVAAALIGLGLGVLVRHTAGALAVAFGLLFLAPVFFESDARDWVVAVGRALPGNALETLAFHRTGPLWLPPTAEAVVVLVAYPLLALVAAAVAVHRRDA